MEKARLLSTSEQLIFIGVFTLVLILDILRINVLRKKGRILFIGNDIIVPVALAAAIFVYIVAIFRDLFLNGFTLQRFLVDIIATLPPAFFFYIISLFFHLFSFATLAINIVILVYSPDSESVHLLGYETLIKSFFGKEILWLEWVLFVFTGGLSFTGIAGFVMSCLKPNNL